VTNQGAVVPEAFVLETLRTTQTKTWPRGGFGGVSPAGRLAGLQCELVGRTDIDPGPIEDVSIGCASQNAEQAVVSGAAALGVAVLVERVAS
jgi:acetyl-CoA acetyltransferase